jgi:hypothetical protein
MIALQLSAISWMALMSFRLYRRIFREERFGGCRPSRRSRFSYVEYRGRSQRKSLASASRDDENANRVGRRIGEAPTTRSVVPRSALDRRQSRRQLEARRRPGAAVAAHNCKPVRVPGKAQLYRCRHSSTQRIRTRTRASPILSQ